MSHPVSRRGDQYVALDKTTGGDADIQTISFPSETALTPAPDADHNRRSRADAGLVAGGLQLGFVRTTGGRRVLPVFDLTPGLQSILNPPIDLGADAPTPQTRAFQSSWGGLSIAESSALDVPVVTCTTTASRRCGPRSPRWCAEAGRHDDHEAQTIGIFVVRVTGKRKLLGRSRAPDPAGRPRPARQDPQGPQHVPLEREGERQAAEARDLPADVPGAAARAGRQHLRLHPLHRERNGPIRGARRVR